MSACKRCPRGHVIYPNNQTFPSKCPSCGRTITGCPVIDIEELEEEISFEQSSDTIADAVDSDICEEEASEKSSFVLASENGDTIEIPNNGGIIGRTEIGAEILAKYPSVSRKHIKIIPSFVDNGIMVEDISQFGTFCDGEQLEKDNPTAVFEGSTLTLCNVDFKLQRR